MASTISWIERGAITMQRTSSALAVFILVLGITACAPTRSVEAYCGVMEKHKERYLTSADDALASDNILAGGLLLASASADLQLMFEEAAKVAPDEIALDVEQVAKYWASQEDNVKDSLSNPLAGLAGAFTGAIFNNGALTRVNDYTATNCPSVGRMF